MINNLVLLPLSKEVNEGSMMDIMAEVHKSSPVEFEAIINIVENNDRLGVQQVKAIDAVTLRTSVHTFVNRKKIIKYILTNLFDSRKTFVTYYDPKGIVKDIVDILTRSRHTANSLDVMREIGEINKAADFPLFECGYNTNDIMYVKTDKSYVEVLNVAGELYMRKGKKIKIVHRITTILKSMSKKNHSDYKITSHEINGFKVSYDSMSSIFNGDLKYAVEKLETKPTEREHENLKETLHGNSVEIVEPETVVDPLKINSIKFMLSTLDIPESKALLEELVQLNDSNPTEEEIKSFHDKVTKYTLAEGSKVLKSVEGGAGHSKYMVAGMVDEVLAEFNTSFLGIYSLLPEDLRVKLDALNDNSPVELLDKVIKEELWSYVSSLPKPTRKIEPKVDEIPVDKSEVTIKDIIEALASDSANKPLANLIAKHSITIDELKSSLDENTVNQLLSLKPLATVNEVKDARNKIKDHIINNNDVSSKDVDSKPVDK